MNLKFGCDHFLTIGQETGGLDAEDAFHKVLERMLDQVDSLASFLFGPESREALEMAMLPDVTPDGQTGGGMSYQPVQVVKQKIDRKPPGPDRRLRHSPLQCTLHNRSLACWPWDKAEMICPCPEVHAQDAAAQLQRRRALAPLTTMAWLLRLFHSGHNAEACDHSRFLNRLKFGPKIWSTGRNGLHWAHSRSLEAALDISFADHYRRWYTKDRKWCCPTRSDLEPLMLTSRCESLFHRSFNSFNRAPGAGVVFGEMGVTMLSPFNPEDDISLLDDVALPLSRPGGTTSKLLGPGRRLMSKLARKFSASLGYDCYHVTVALKNAARARSLTANCTQHSHKGFYPNGHGVLFLTSAGNLVFLGRDRVPSLNLKQVYLEMDSPHSFVVKNPGTTQTLKFICAFPETWRAVFEAVGVLKKISYRVEMQEAGEWSAPNWLHAKRNIQWQTALRQALGEGDSQALEKNLQNYLLQT